MYVELARITTTASSEEEQTERREHLAEIETIGFDCYSTGYPSPEKIWYFNGELAPIDIFRVNDGNELVILTAQVRHSGVYECVVTNTINGQPRDDRRQWLLEVRAPSK